MDVISDDGYCPQLENAVGWALYALEPEEERVLRAHLPGCSLCRETMRSTEQVAAQVGAATPHSEPPPALRRRLLAAIQEAPRPLPPPPVDLSVHRARRRSRSPLAAAAAVVAVLGGATMVLGVQVSHLTSQQQAQAAGEAMVRSVVGDPVAKRAVLTNSGGTPVAMIVTSPSGAVVVPLGLAPNAANHTYVTWGLLPSGPIALASFDVPADSAGPVVVNWPATAAGLTRFAISVEPGRTMPMTPTNVIASGSDT
jgi:hypothetical protein